MVETTQKIVIVGGGTAGWMTAAALARVVPPELFSVTLVESEQIGTVGVGEATIPHIREFNYMLGIDENEFMQAVSATYKLGIRFKGWGTELSDYYHPFGTQGNDIQNIAFHHYWLKAYLNGEITAFDDFSFANLAAKKERFAPPSLEKDSATNAYSYAYHMDAGAYAEYLRKYAETRGITRIEGKIVRVNQDQSTGEITNLSLENGSDIKGDLFVDCSGFASLLLAQKLNATYEDWSHWLPCDSAFAVQSQLPNDPVPYTVSTARKAGWQWRIPLQKRMGNGYVYCSKFTPDSEAQLTLTENIEGQLITEPRKIKFTAGFHTQSWIKNCVAIGLSSGFLEPLESTSIYLIQVAIYKLLKLLPIDKDYEIEREEFNRELKLEYQRIRDFLILHYKLNNRNDSEFWRYCREMTIPESLAHKISLFKTSAHVAEYQKGLFKRPSWLAVFIGQGLIPDNVHPLLAFKPTQEVVKILNSMFQELNEKSDKLPFHKEALSNPIKVNHQLKGRPGFSLYGDTR